MTPNGLSVVIHFAEGVEYSGLIVGLDFGPRNLMEPVMQGGDARTWYRSLDIDYGTRYDGALSISSSRSVRHCCGPSTPTIPVGPVEGWKLVPSGDQ